MSLLTGASRSKGRSLALLVALCTFSGNCADNEKAYIPGDRTADDGFLSTTLHFTGQADPQVGTARVVMGKIPTDSWETCVGGTILDFDEIGSTLRAVTFPTLVPGTRVTTENIGMTIVTDDGRRDFTGDLEILTWGPEQIELSAVGEYCSFDTAVHDCDTAIGSVMIRGLPLEVQWDPINSYWHNDAGEWMCGARERADR
jgi:hypothetical protein